MLRISSHLLFFEFVVYRNDDVDTFRAFNARSTNAALSQSTTTAIAVQSRICKSLRSVCLGSPVLCLCLGSRLGLHHLHLSATLYNMQQSDNDTLLACSRPQRENHLSNYQQSRVSARHLWCSGPISPSFPQAATRQALDTLSTATGKITCQTTQPAITSATYSPRRRPRPSKMTLTPRRTRTALCSAAVPSG